MTFRHAVGQAIGRGANRRGRRRPLTAVGLTGAALVAACLTGADAEGSEPGHADLSGNAGKTITAQSPQLLTTNLVIKPGTRDGYLVVGGDNGGFVYTFRALGLGVGQSNGGGAGA
ncbi:hypothetical protein ACWD4J_29925 [Streptomyces sp. NPDC002577]